MAYEFRMVHTVGFADTDMAGIMHFANFFRYMEVTEHAFLRSLDLSVHMTLDGRKIGWPRVHAACDYRRPLRFDDRVEVHLTVRELRQKAIYYDFVFRKLGENGPEEVARGEVTAVCVAIEAAANGTDTARLSSVTIPEAFLSRIESAPAAEGAAR